MEVAELSGCPCVTVKMSQSRQNALRGMHFETGPTEQAKFLRVCSGSVVEVALDLKTGDLYEVSMSAASSRTFFIPAGFAHGYRSLSDDTVIVYLTTNRYEQAYAAVYCPLISHFPGFDWGGGQGDFEMSDRDRQARPFPFRDTAQHFRLSNEQWKAVDSSPQRGR